MSSPSALYPSWSVPPVEPDSMVGHFKYLVIKDSPSRAAFLTPLILGKARGYAMKTLRQPKQRACGKGHESVAKRHRGTEVLHQSLLWGHTPQAPHSPSLNTEERAPRQQQGHQCFNGCGSLFVWSRILEQHPTMSVDSSKDPRARRGSLWYQGQREVISYKGIDIRCALQSPGEPAERPLLLNCLSRGVWSND